jgi:4-aminobutyrate aminotransferase
MSGTDFYYEPQVRSRRDGGDRSRRRRHGEGPVVLQQLRREAIEAAIKLARYTASASTSSRFSGRFTAARSGACRDLEQVRQRRGFGPMMPGMFHAPYANCYVSRSA